MSPAIVSVSISACAAGKIELCKSPDGYAVAGLWMVTADEVSDPDALPLTLEVNGEVRQRTTSAC